ncbi:MAG: secondary thiamine-phosphate synthase enzyme YjbQ [Aigarchaeota archaeon]|nr:secondary thiamine-phosphate synthase enzyme YjbQ [Aigarchaeota archaeon]MDH5703952.1 secondary thiamine-phosphate synthase enzyme YjbQ [Aigarchaeota archaeon]
MKVFSDTFEVSTRGEVELVNITGRLKESVRSSGVENGIANVLCPHTTCGLYVNEDESRLKRDVENVLEKLVPKGAGYGHDSVDDNAHAHLRTILLSATLTLPVLDGRPVMGTWQNVFCAEFDGPRTRTIRIQVLGE